MEPARKRARSDEVFPVQCFRGHTSFDIFMSFVIYYQANGRTHCDASRIISKKCYLAWIKSRTKTSAFPADTFRRTVIAHLTGTKKRKPFPKQVEESLLKAVRVKRIWPCFSNVFDNKGNPVTFGHVGFRPRGYHESRQDPVSIAGPVLGGEFAWGIGEERKLLEEDKHTGLEIVPSYASSDEKEMMAFFFDLQESFNGF
mmetsp:Transcript_15833/g.25858  ORF Transcript_15833/g.25858 Transcript_15833/m.25858 type:complete len:200 (-) Transcript_15833:1433-2032(-)|eukprot:CAMPEP_0203780834 /NCGR_PEP_ID=MMETSP0099_2-20121227/9755_1 /ASSEMBLY_ACC=CAM_ASM_000209 /TAXON_ID=96639 /ORGANISM=" , Strain NY0313808BC1" /LENGTH=199 /DNA_ID=CAMNT_0050681463 /DNA_START=485 /DNA_END=1084 /DNA_ORIENTATION=+